jgi:hypothetical protein
MTLIVTVNGPETIWLCADRRLSYVGRRPRDDARKLMILETTDGAALLGYAGLGATALVETEPSDWMSAALRGRNLPLELSLAVLTEAMNKELPRHMARLPVDGGPAHYMLAPAFVNGELRLYSIDLAFSPDRSNWSLRFARHQWQVGEPERAIMRTQQIGIAGSGAPYLLTDRGWLRPLLRLVRASDRKKVHAHSVADYLATLNHSIHLKDAALRRPRDASVGPSCIVSWRHRRGGVHKEGGGHSFYTGTTRDPSSPTVPMIANGMDVAALAGALMPVIMKSAEKLRTGGSFADLTTDRLRAAMAHLPTDPDERLR